MDNLNVILGIWHKIENFSNHGDNLNVMSAIWKKCSLKTSPILTSGAANKMVVRRFSGSGAYWKKPYARRCPTLQIKAQSMSDHDTY